MVQPVISHQCNNHKLNVSDCQQIVKKIVMNGLDASRTAFVITHSRKLYLTKNLLLEEKPDNDVINQKC